MGKKASPAEGKAGPSKTYQQLNGEVIADTSTSTKRGVTHENLKGCCVRAGSWRERGSADMVCEHILYTWGEGEGGNLGAKRGFSRRTQMIPRLRVAMEGGSSATFEGRLQAEYKEPITGRAELGNHYLSRGREIC